MKKILYRSLLKDITVFSLIALFSYAIIIWVFQAVNYLDLIVGEMLPKINAENLADYVDAFCETNYFSVEETEFVIKEALKFGLKPKVHVNQFTSIGGIQKCVELNAV